MKITGVKDTFAKELATKRAIKFFTEKEYPLLTAALNFIIQEDCVVSDFLDGKYFEDLLCDLITLKCAWIASDDRVLLTKRGDDLLADLFETMVDFDAIRVKFTNNL